MPLNKGYLTAKTDKASDEVYTPTYAVTPLIKYIKIFNPNAVIWCPFDTPQSEYVKVFSQAGFKVIYSHIDEGKNFFFYEPEEPYDIIISNPPYIPAGTVLQKEVMFDPKLALFASDKDGLEFYEKISKNAPKILNTGGYLLFELGVGQSQAVKDIMAQAGFKDFEIIKDLAGIDRVISAHL